METTRWGGARTAGTDKAMKGAWRRAGPLVPEEGEVGPVWPPGSSRRWPCRCSALGPSSTRARPARIADHHTATAGNGEQIPWTSSEGLRILTCCARSLPISRTRRTSRATPGSSPSGDRSTFATGPRPATSSPTGAPRPAWWNPRPNDSCKARDSGRPRYWGPRSVQGGFPLRGVLLGDRPGRLLLDRRGDGHEPKWPLGRPRAAARRES